MRFIGIDPGSSGAAAMLSGDQVEIIRFDQTEHDISDQFARWQNDSRAVIERVSAMPKQGVASTFKFGMAYGFIRGLLVANRIPFREVTPTKWQTAMKCRTKGNKNITKAAAQKLYPTLKVTHRNADAILIAEYGRAFAWESVAGLNLGTSSRNIKQPTRDAGTPLADLTKPFS